MKKVWRKLRWSMAQRGVWATLRVVLAKGLRRGAGGVVEHPFDEEFGVDTSGLIGGGELASGAPNDRYSTAYHGVPPGRFYEAMERWQATAGTESIETYTFVDIGCGKGRAVMLAAEMPFREVVGVELSAELVAVAESNVQRWRELGQELARARAPMRVLQGDAAEFVLPEGPLLVYLYNPFGAPVLRALLRRLARADVLYLVPEQEAVFGEVGGFRLLWSERFAAGDVVVDQVVSAEDKVSLYRR